MRSLLECLLLPTNSASTTTTANTATTFTSDRRRHTVLVSFPRTPSNRIKPYFKPDLCRHSFIISHALHNPSSNFFKSIADAYVDPSGLSHVVLKQATGVSFEAVLDHIARRLSPGEAQMERDTIGTRFPQIKLGMMAQVYRAARLLAVEPVVKEMEKRMMAEAKSVPMPVWNDVLVAWAASARDEEVPRQIIAEGLAERIAEEVFVSNQDSLFTGEARIWREIFGDAKYAAIPGLQNAVTEKHQWKRELMLMCLPTPH
ncbi:MAG: hypothetical protein Q9160_005986 [Pyrenula sp. 1 TL-2023]